MRIQKNIHKPHDYKPEMTNDLAEKVQAELKEVDPKSEEEVQASILANIVEHDDKTKKVTKKNDKRRKKNNSKNSEVPLWKNLQLPS